MLWSPFTFFWHLPMGWVWLGRHCGTKLYPTRLWGDCQGLLEVDWTCAQYYGRIFMVYKCLLYGAWGMQYICIKAHLKCITRWNFGWYPLNWGIRCGKAEGLRWWVVFLGGSQGPKPKGLQALRGFGRGTFQGAPFAAVHSIAVQFMCVQHSGTAPVCAVVQWYRTCVCSAVVQQLCVQYSGTALVYAVQWYSTRVCSTVV